MVKLCNVEEDKEIFWFRKHPIKELTEGKKQRKKRASLVVKVLASIRVIPHYHGEVLFLSSIFGTEKWKPDPFTEKPH